ncbi:MAG TPA: hypothetical protein VGR61_08835 [Candidatus Dormibacteraeota bacterium]|nr:hypothetical protein [Candidatus Dormibacteraeota bacterium]
MDDTEDIAEESPQALDRGPADPAVTEPAAPGTDSPDEVELDPTTPDLEARKPALYVLRPQGLRPAPRTARRRLGRLRNDCPPDRRRPSNRPALKPRIR